MQINNVYDIYNKIKKIYDKNEERNIKKMFSCFATLDNDFNKIFNIEEEILKNIGMKLRRIKLPKKIKRDLKLINQNNYKFGK